MHAVDADDIARAAERLAPHVRRTPLLALDAFGPRLACKAEHLQTSGSFKFRGAMHRLLLLDEGGRRRGVLTASTGNHGIAMATAGRRLSVPVKVLVAQGTDASILDRLRGLGAEVEQIESRDCVDAEREARRQAGIDGRVFVSPYDDPAVIAGQGTIAVELLDQLDELGWDGVDAVTVAVGGGGLISGIAAWLAAAAPRVRVIGAQPEVDAAMAASVAAGRIVAVEGGATLSHSTAGGVDDDAITFPLCRDLVSEWIRVPETAIASAVRTMFRDELQLVEGAAGVALAAAREVGAVDPDARVLAVSCGARLTRAELDAVLAG